MHFSDSMEQEILEQQMEEDAVFELHQDAYNYRPSQSFIETWRSATSEEKQVTWDMLSAALESEQEREHRINDRISADFEKSIQATIDAGAGNRETALRWMFQEYNSNPTMLEHEIYEQNLLFVGDYEEEIKRAVGI